MNWEDAKAKCKSLGMRLPIINELSPAYDDGLMVSWEKNGYWSSTLVDAEHSYILNIYTGNKQDSSHINTYSVRCLH